MKKSIVYHKFSSFWLIYFIIRLSYLFFTVFVYTRLTNIGDFKRYLSSGIIHFSPIMFLNSTILMDYIGGLIGVIFHKNIILSNLFFMIISFASIKWTIEKLSLQKKINRILLLAILSLPNMCIWTSICSKEVFGILFSSILAVLIVNFIRGNYRISMRDLIGFLLCFVFKPQYLVFILQGLLYIYATRTMLKHNSFGQIFLFIFFIFINILFLYLIRDTVNFYAFNMQWRFSTEAAGSTRSNIFLHENDFFRKIPWGMFIAFWGPTMGEMLNKPLQAIAGVESLIIIIIFIFLSKTVLYRIILKGKIFASMIFGYFIIFVGICFIHYPFGVFNPGSAIRYRNNFLFLFIVLLLYLYTNYKDKRINV